MGWQKKGRMWVLIQVFTKMGEAMDETMKKLFGLRSDQLEAVAADPCYRKLCDAMMETPFHKDVHLGLMNCVKSYVETTEYERSKRTLVFGQLPYSVNLFQDSRENLGWESILIWRARGGAAAAMAAIRSGSRDEALQAAMALRDLAGDSGAADVLAEPDAVRSLLQVFDFNGLGPIERNALQRSLEVVVEASRDAAAQLVAAYADPDPWIAFAQSSTLAGSQRPAVRALTRWRPAWPTRLLPRFPTRHQTAGARPHWLPLPQFTPRALSSGPS